MKRIPVAEQVFKVPKQRLHAFLGALGHSERGEHYTLGQSIHESSDGKHYEVKVVQYIKADPEEFRDLALICQELTNIVIYNETLIAKLRRYIHVQIKKVMALIKKFTTK